MYTYMVIIYYNINQSDEFVYYTRGHNIIIILIQVPQRLDIRGGYLNFFLTKYMITLTKKKRNIIYYEGEGRIKKKLLVLFGFGLASATTTLQIHGVSIAHRCTDHLHLSTITATQQDEPADTSQPTHKSYDRVACELSELLSVGNELKNVSEDPKPPRPFSLSLLSLSTP